MIFRFVKLGAASLAFAFAIIPVLAGATDTTDVGGVARAQQTSRANAEGSPSQRLEVLRSRLDGMRRSLNSAIAGLNAQGGDDSGKKGDASSGSAAAEALTRLRGLEREAGSLLSDVYNLRGKVDRAERYDPAEIGKLESAVNDLNERVEGGLRATASERRGTGGSTVASNAGNSGSSSKSRKKKKGLFGRLNPFSGGGNDEKYSELTGTVAPGRDRQLFEEAARETRKGRYDTARLLFNVIVTTYTDSPYLPLAKLAVADTFYLEGSTSALIQANASYRDWLAFFPTHPLADDAMMKMAEAEMRQMGLADRDVSHARKAEQQLKVIVQQFPETPLKEEVKQRLNEVQENLALHSLQVAKFYIDRHDRGVATNAKGAQSRLREIAEKYPNFSYMDEVLFSLGMTYVQEEEPDEAAKYFQRILRDYPNSKFIEKASEQLDLIGAAKPQPDPARMNVLPPERPGILGSVLREVTGTVPITVDKDGVLISKDDDKQSLIDEAIANGGELRNDRTPNAPTAITRRPPARTLVAPTAPASQPATRTGTGTSAPRSTVTTNPNATSTSGERGVSIQPTQPGPPPGGSNVPTQQQPPQVTAPTTPNTATTPSASGNSNSSGNSSNSSNTNNSNTTGTTPPQP